MGYRLNRLDELVLIEVSKPLLTEFWIHHRLESCVMVSLLHFILSLLRVERCSEGPFKHLWTFLHLIETHCDKEW